VGEPSKHPWFIPLFIRIGAADGSEQKIQVDMTEREQTFTIPKGTYYKLNADQYVLARVKYSQAMTEALENPVREMKLPPVDRTAILDDAFVLAQAKEITFDDAALILPAYAKEEHYVPWVRILTTLSKFYGVFEGAADAADFEGAADQLFSTFKGFVALMIDPIFKKIGFDKKETDGHLDSQLREMLVEENF
jgi:puromycin-sensitive aminopeptidase